METFHQFLSILALLCLVVRGRNAASLQAAQVYWNSHLPNTPIPTPLRQLVHADSRIRSDFLNESLLVPQRGRRVSYKLGYWPEAKTFNKNQAFNTTVFFLRDDLRPYKRTNTIFPKSSDSINFLPNKAAKSIPFSSSKFPEILNYTSIKSTSKEAQVMKQTIKECEAPAIKGEDKHCATSLEALVDYVISRLGKRVKTLFNEVEKENKQQIYTIQNGIKMIGGNHNIVCHKERYAYAVYYCHNIEKTNVYKVPMRGEDGSKANAAVVCHLDTSDWNPRHFAFQVLNVKPGGPPVCHFLNSDTIVFLPNKNLN